MVNSLQMLEASIIRARYHANGLELQIGQVQQQLTSAIHLSNGTFPGIQGLQIRETNLRMALDETVQEIARLEQMLVQEKSRRSRLQSYGHAGEGPSKRRKH